MFNFAIAFVIGLVFGWMLPSEKIPFLGRFLGPKRV